MKHYSVFISDSLWYMNGLAMSSHIYRLKHLMPCLGAVLDTFLHAQPLNPPTPQTRVKFCWHSLQGFGWYSCANSREHKPSPEPLIKLSQQSRLTFWPCFSAVASFPGTVGAPGNANQVRPGLLWIYLFSYWIALRGSFHKSFKCSDATASRGFAWFYTLESLWFGRFQFNLQLRRQSEIPGL